ncbi:hypothetical protein SH584_02615 [Sphingomonas sp. LY29]|uniref:hypothetical protein n=1 Tax=Sphingomonas sp. LY29 TaxID=3095341 RepID=UPI002D7941AD|nr:hypothetical protein [Sphingomonas sp. LY29]WRP26350.1 hypothetical protein SH584_02615 [Sphingomonas sp. LY29]
MSEKAVSTGVGIDGAMRLMTEALIILDENDMPADIGAHLDLAINRLRDHMRGPIQLFVSEVANGEARPPELAG